MVQEKNKIAGYLSARDFFVERGKSLKEITYSSCAVTVNQNAPELLQNFKYCKHNFSIVVNNTGGLAGVVTMHDVAEILIGKIP